MKKAIINKHVNSSSDIVLNRGIFVSDDDLAKGEIIICNDSNDPSIYILDTRGNVTKISGGSNHGGGESPSYDDTEIWKQVNDNKENIENVKTTLRTEIISGDTELRELIGRINEIIGSVESGKTVSGLLDEIDEKVNEQVSVINGNIESIANSIRSELSSGDNELKSLIDDVSDTIGDIESGDTVIELISDINTMIDETNGNISSIKGDIDNYTVNGKKISETPVINSDDLLVSDKYTTFDTEGTLTIGDSITNALGKLEKMLNNANLALTAAVIDLEKKIGNETEYDDNGEIIRNATGLYMKYEELASKLQ